MTSKKLVIFLKLIMICGVVITALKILLTGFDIDEQYAVVMSYRMLKGDFLLSHMWEPHQTSGFLAALLMLPFLSAAKSTVGVVLYLRLCGLLLHTLVAGLLYRELKYRYAVKYAFSISCIFFFSLPKIMFLPEFSNIQTGLLVLMILCLLRYYNPDQEQSSVWYLAAAGFLVSLEVLTYPSTILVFLSCILLILIYGRTGRLLKELAAFILPCFISAGIFFTVLLHHMTFKELLTFLPLATTDGSHSASFMTKLTMNLSSIGEIGIYFLIYGLLALILYFCIPDHQESPFLWFRILLTITLVSQVGIWIWGNRYPNYPLVEYFFLAGFGLYYRWKTRTPHPWHFIFVGIPCVAFVGIILFTNHPLLVSSPFLIPCVTGSLTMPGLHTASSGNHKHALFSWRNILLLWVFVLLFGKCYMLRTTSGSHYTLFDEISLIRKGPAVGIVADTQTVRQYHSSWDLLQDVLPVDSSVFYAGTSSIIYMMQNVEISTPSTISSPTFDEKISLYFSYHPEKYPDYVICDVSLSDLNIDSWLSGWIKENCHVEPYARNDYLVIYQTK